MKFIAVAPMMDWTDRHCRYFHRLIAPHLFLYTEMMTAEAILHGNTRTLLSFDPTESPVALQLGGSCPNTLARAAKIGEAYGYHEINLNIGCPSDRVVSGRFGACLMAEASLVKECVAAMQDQINIPVTVKCRIGIDDQDSYAFLSDFIATVSSARCDTFIIHARKALLKGLTPKQNREIPPLKYEVVRNIKKDFPHLKIIINGGIKTISDIKMHLEQVDGVMIGREAYHHPYFLADIEKHFFNFEPLSRENVIGAMKPYIESELIKGTRLHHITRHMLGLFHEMPGAKSWRRLLSENVYKKEMGFELIEKALKSLFEAASAP